jgi:hypothetical protein
MLGTVSLLVRALCVCVAVCLGPATAHSTRVNVTTTTTTGGKAPAPAPALSTSHGGGGVPQQSPPEFHRKLANAYEVIYNGKTYSLLSHAAPDSTSMTCQSAYLPLDAGYVIAPDNADSIAVIAAHRWSTTAVVVASGNGYYTANSGTSAGSFDGSGWLQTSGSTYKATGCNVQILQVCSAILLFVFMIALLI